MMLEDDDALDAVEVADVDVDDGNMNYSAVSGPTHNCRDNLDWQQPYS